MTVNDSKMCVRWKDELIFNIEEEETEERNLNSSNRLTDNIKSRPITNKVNKKVNFDIYIADRKATTCI